MTQSNTTRSTAMTGTVARWLPTLATLVAVQLAGTSLRADTLYAGHNGSIVSFDTTANPPTPTTFANTGANNNYGLAFDSAGNLYVAHNNSGTIEKFTPGGVGSIFASGLPDVQGLAIGRDGNLYVADASHNRIDRFTPGGVESVFANTAPFGPIGLAFDGAGNLYASFQGPSQSIEKFTPGGVGSVFASTAPFGPAGLAFDVAGNLYVAISAGGGNTIEKITPGGVGSTFATGLSEPVGLAFDSAGNLYVANAAGTTIERFTPGGVGSTFVSNFDGPIFLAIQPSAVPEPSTLVLMVLGGLSLVGYRLLRQGGMLTSS